MRELTTLEKREADYYTQLEEAPDVYAGRDALVGLGFTHLAMEPAKIKLAVQELWTGMHGRSGLENLGIVAKVAVYISGGSLDPETLEYADALREDRRTASSDRKLDV